LQVAVADHVESEVASFHFPGHKNRAPAPTAVSAELPLWQSDVTELPDLDDLAYPHGVLKGLAGRASRLWRSESALLSVNGASAGNVACMLAAVSHGSHVLVPRNAHRSIINGLIISGLMPIWYAPEWDARWGVWGGVDAGVIEKALFSIEKAHRVAAVIVTSPTYAGAISDIKKIAELCRRHGVLTIVDEAHGAHLVDGAGLPDGAISCGADLVVHSLHKTLGGLTQCGAVHVGTSSPVSLADLQNAINLVQSSSPSYPLMVSMERAIEQLEVHEGREKLKEVLALAKQLRAELVAMKCYAVYDSSFATDPLHILVSHERLCASALQSFLLESGIYPEATLGNGLLLTMGMGSDQEDIDLLLRRLQQGAAAATFTTPAGNDESLGAAGTTLRPPQLEQVFAPREAWLMPSHLVSREEAEDQIVADYFAPCPPGIPICVPGQRLEKGVIPYLPDFVRIVS
jgi:arginine/lysine/ornithine decarboxylase